jgi:hypothetical protein
MRRFNPTWFKEYKWLEYSIEKDAAYCFILLSIQEICLLLKSLVIGKIKK